MSPGGAACGAGAGTLHGGAGGGPCSPLGPHIWRIILVESVAAVATLLVTYVYGSIDCTGGS